jgi:two-component system sensor histidine kinase BaeS
MTDAARRGHGPGGRLAGRIRLDSLRSRLALCFLGVALAAIGLLAGLTVTFASADVSSLVHRQRDQLTGAIAAAAAAGWDRRDSWAGADLSPALELASRTGAEAEIKDSAGLVITHSAGFAMRGPQPQFRALIRLRGLTLGEALVRFSGTGLGGADRTLQSALLRAIATAAALAALVALITGIAIASRLSQPVAHVIAVTRARRTGERAARAGQVRGPAEMRELATSFDEAADMLDRQEQLRRDLVADVAHELRTPIAILQAGHEALLDGLAEPTPEQFTSLRDEVLRLARMVDDLQTLAAADAAALHLELGPCDLAAIAANAAASLASRLAAAGITLESQLGPATVLADPRWIHQVITNLLTNAVKFSPPGSVVSLAVIRTAEGAELRVTDHGVGIPADDLPHIFDRFWRGSQAAQISGSGIGLAVAAEIAAAHGGQLTVSSEPGQGTQVALIMPVAAARALARPATASGPSR